MTQVGGPNSSGTMPFVYQERIYEGLVTDAGSNADRPRYFKFTIIAGSAHSKAIKYPCVYFEVIMRITINVDFDEF